MKKILIGILLIGLIILIASCGSYSTEGSITGKYEEGGSYYVQVTFIDKLGETTTFNHNVTKEGYETFKIGDSTPVNVEDSTLGIVPFVIIGSIALVGSYAYMKYDKKKKRIEESDELDMEETDDELPLPIYHGRKNEKKVSRKVKEKPRFTIFGIKIK